MAHLTTVIFWIILPLSTFIFTIGCYLSHVRYLFRNKRRAEIAAHSCANYWARTIMTFTPGWKIRIEGRENLPDRGSPARIIVANHQSAADIVAIYYLDLQFRWLAKQEAFEVPFIGTSMRLAGYVPIERDNPDSRAKALADSEKKLAEGHHMFFFPEGTRSKTSEMKPFKLGAFRLAEDTDSAVLPICIEGARDLIKKGALLPRPAQVTVRILPEQRQSPGEDAADFAARVRALIAKHQQMIRARSTQKEASSNSVQASQV